MRTVLLPALFALGCTTDVKTDPGSTDPLPLQASEVQVQQTSSATDLSYELTMSGHIVRLDLTTDPGPFGPGYVEYRIEDGVRTQVPMAEQANVIDCWYRGTITIDGRPVPNGVAAMRTCTRAGDEQLDGMLLLEDGLWSVSAEGGSHVLAPVPAFEIDQIEALGMELAEMEAMPAQFGPPGAPAWVEMVGVNDALRSASLGAGTEDNTALIIHEATSFYLTAATRPVRLALMSQTTFVGSDPWTATRVGSEVDVDSLLDLFTAWRNADPEASAADHATLFSADDFDGSTIGYAGVGTMCGGRSTSLVEATGFNNTANAATTAHEIGHSFNMRHDSQLGCSSGTHIMSAFLPFPPATEFSVCSSATLEATLEASSSNCLDNEPGPVFASPTCGNGIVEAGEQCDCASDDCSTIDPCCNGSTCQFNAGATCSALDACCDENTCGVVPASAELECRGASDTQCDVAETCNGVQSTCPSDVSSPPGETCGTNGGCLLGDCASVEQQCTEVGEIFAGVVYSPTCESFMASNPCGRLLCGTPGGGCSSFTFNGSQITANDGTPCGSGQQCFEGTCQDSSNLPDNSGCPDGDGDGVCDDVDVCLGDDASGDSDNDDVCDDQDVCLGDDAAGDSDSDGVCDDLDACPGIDDNLDADGDGVTACAGDCDDTDPLATPGATEICDDVDNNCDGTVDEGFDLDGDGFTSCNGDCDDTDPNSSPDSAEVCDGFDNDCDATVDEGFDLDADGQTSCAGDCDDTNAAVFTGASEVCDGADNDCDGTSDEGFDADGDGQTTCGGDCDDTNNLVFTGAPETCDTVDNDCDGSADEGFDLDGDGQTTCGGDCDDSNPAVFTGANEVCDGLDNDCDGTADNGFDADSDGQTTCGGDCDDTNPAVFAGATETCNGTDDNCDGTADEGFDNDGDGQTTCGGDCNDNDPAVSSTSPELCNNLDDNCDGFIDEDLTIDADQDGFFAVGSCGGGDDCDDADDTVFPGALELCDGVDNDCDLQTDEGLTTDLDGDGFTAPGSCDGEGDDCDDEDATINPVATEVCDDADNDCDGSTDEGFDVDGDGFTTCGGDCDDTNITVNIEAPELCDNLDNDCDLQVDEGLSTDADGDGFTAPGSCAGEGDDCDDLDATINPIAGEVCDGVDNNCNGSADEGLTSDVDGDGFTSVGSCAGSADDCDDTNAAVNPGASEVCDELDNNCNGSADEGLTTDADGDGFTSVGSCEGTADDCDDSNASTNPGADEVCDEVDNNCDGSADEGLTTDADGDGFSSLGSCAGSADDCDDAVASTNPGASEACNGVDDNCDGSADEGLTTDADGDGFTTPGSCEGSADDCDDAAASINPGALEACNGLDDNCDGGVDEGLTTDADGDGFTTPGSCEGTADDCDDAVASTNPGANETCNGVDDNCDGGVDEGLTTDAACAGITTTVSVEGYADGCVEESASTNPGAIDVCDGVDNNCDGGVDEGLTTDADGDGFTAPGSCEGSGDDCDDTNAAVNPGGSEACDGLDNNCSGEIDEGLTTDADGDGFTSLGSCEGSADDCNDADGAINPQAAEVCDGADNNCDGGADEGLTTDADGDGFTSVGSCAGSADDCDDAVASTNPGAADVCDGVDNNCDGGVDEGLTTDADGDGFTAPGSCEGSADDCDDAVASTNPGAGEQCNGVDDNCDGGVDEGLTDDADGDGYTSLGSCAGSADDCDDTNSAVNPDATEACNGIDDNCDGAIDDSGGDADGDGFTAPGSCTGSADDCDDADNGVFPGAPELCDGLDNDCDLQVDNGLTFDADGDGFTAPGSCDGEGDDCDDADASINPGAAEDCNGLDDDCDGSIDEGLSTDADGDGFTAVGACVGTGDDCDDADDTINPDATEVCDGVDNDCDDSTDEGLTFDIDNDGFTSVGSCQGSGDDCDDTDPMVSPEATEFCDAIDNDCDGAVDEGLSFDLDEDGFTSPDSCEGSADDCDDEDASVNAEALEVCDGVDNNCDEAVDEGLTFDADGDGFTSAGSCQGSANDCDDADGAINPGATEVCDDIDNNCSGAADEGLTTDADGDGFSSLGSCDGTADDCNDADGTINPGAAEVCDDLDNNCDGSADEGLTSDLDADGFTSLGSCAGTADDCDDADDSTNPGAAEVCDGVDNNCNEDTDEGLTVDLDDDGFTSPGSCEGTADDCDDADGAINPGAVEVCDELDNDCNGEADEGLTFDLDGDGFTSANSCEGSADDCDDADASINPDAVEVCDELDNNCSGEADEGLTLDADGDGFSSPDSCGGTADDCDDDDASTNPEAAEVCDDADNDCDALIDEGLTTDADGDGFTALGSCQGSADDCDDSDDSAFPGGTEVCDDIDNNCNGEADEGLTLDADGDGFSSLGSCGGTADDCNDANAAINPGAAEACDGLDNDCNGSVDDGLTLDADGDGFTSVGSCAGTADDCDDTSDTTFPDADELCDEEDNNCDGDVDEGLTFDLDDDGFTDVGSCEGSADDCDDDNAVVFPGANESCDGLDNDCDALVDEGLTSDLDGDGFSAPGSCEGTGDDCDDTNAAVNPGAAEVCDDIDNNCNGALNDGLSTDSDGDGFTDPGSCEGSADDCDDANAAINPGAAETCDGADNNCSGEVDEGLDIDADGDGFFGTGSCATADDCDDAVASTNPGATEVCNEVDDNCDGTVDEGLTTDADGDGFTASGSCEGAGDDCDDADGSINPGAAEVCDEVDNNCDGGVDEGLTTDADGDGFTAPGSCEGTGDDCDDAVASTNPGASEVCNEVDDNCNGSIDEDLDIDEDADGFLSVDSCSGGTDCDDANDAINPGATEVCDGADNNCDGALDEGFDLDGDGITDCAGDNCPNDANPDQADLDEDELGDVCDDDDDGDLVADIDDADPADPNVCQDLDADLCDDCAVAGMPDIANDGADADSDGVCDLSDACTGDDAAGDSDSDGVCDDLDACTGDDAAGDSDSDGVCDDLDACTGDDTAGDSDSDGVCDDLDACTGDDTAGDSDSDGVCDDLDACAGDDSAGDTDNDGVCDDLDVCVGDDGSGDGDGDGVCDSDDLCAGDDGLGDLDGDGFCGDEDCDDTDGGVSPDADELCDDGVDNNCDGMVDEGCNSSTCGDGVVEAAPSAPSCANSRYQAIYSRSALDSWLANPVRSIDIRANIDFGGDDLSINTNCRVRQRYGALSGLGDVFIAGSSVDIGGDIFASGDVTLLGSYDVDLWSSGFISASTLTAEAEYIFQRSDMVLSGPYCVEAMLVDFNRRSDVDSLGSTVEVYGDGVYLDGNIDGAQSVSVITEELSMGSAGDIDHVSGDVTLLADSAMYVGGDTTDIGGLLSLQSSELYVDSGARLEAGTVDVLADAYTQVGDIRSSGDVTIDITGDATFGYDADVVANGDIDVDVGGYLASAASFRDNGNVTFDATTYFLTVDAQFSNNISCAITGTADVGSAPAVGCVENGGIEICGDNLDNDGDGQVDEDCPPVSCPAGEVEDCDGFCWPENWLADGYCDDGSLQSWGDPNFNCAVYNFDEGDCTDSCPNGYVEDCAGSCYPVSWIGDGACDDGTAYPWGDPDFLCPMWNDDDGDCAP